jgi:ketosteroid isomerase-like protein
MRFVGLLFTACASAPSASPTPAGDGAPEIEAVLDDWHDAASRADEARYFGHFTSDAIFLGTDATERWDVAAFRAYSHPFFARGRAWSFRAVRRAVVIDARGDLAWFDEDLATENLGPARGSGVLRRERGRWRIAHYNLAITIPNDRFAEVRDLLEPDDAGAPDAGP